MDVGVDVGSILGELETIGAINASKEPDPIPEVVVHVAAPPPPLPQEPVQEILRALDTIRSNLLLLVDGRSLAKPEPKPKSKEPRKRKLAKEDLAPFVEKTSVPLSVPTASPAPAPTLAAPPPTAARTPKTLEEARQRVLATIRGENPDVRPLPDEDDEEGLLYVGQDRALPIDLRSAESVGNREAL